MTTVNISAAACLGANETLFFPERRAGQANHGREAKRICASCPIITECLIDAIAGKVGPGIWGGAGESERRMLGRIYADRHADPAAWADALHEHVVALRSGVALVADRNGPGASCGLAASYNRGCRCAACSCDKALSGRRRRKARRSREAVA